MWEYLKSTQGFSNRTFAKEANIKSPTHLFLVMSGKRRMTSALLKKIIKAFSLRTREAEFLNCLIEFDEAPTTLEQEQVYRKILRYKQFSEGRTLSEETLAYYSRWEHIAMLEALGTPMRELGHEALGRLLGLTEAETNSVIETLRALGLIELKGKRWTRMQSIFETPQETRSVLIRAFHREMIKRALSCVDGMSTEERKLFSVTLPLNEKNFEKLSEKIFEAMKEITGEFSSPNDPTGVFQLNLQLFPLLKAQSGNERKQGK
jgi:uncharacterized protein (TIGR02147 family)